MGLNISVSFDSLPTIIIEAPTIPFLASGIFKLPPEFFWQDPANIWPLPCYDKFFQNHLARFLFHTWNQPYLQNALVSFKEKFYFKVKIQVIRMLPQLVILVTPFQWSVTYTNTKTLKYLMTSCWYSQFKLKTTKSLL